jgi:2-polyprenyl-3-methyl-5-hydroxy-6-metoxy-1,4-benzoquinol methylase
MSLENVIACPICNSKNLKKQFSCKDFTYSKKSFDISECTECNLRITTPRPTLETIGEFYKSNQYISHSSRPENLIERIYFLARKIGLRNKKNLIEKYSKPGKLLDFGCGTGSFMQYMNENSWETFGIEASKEAREVSLKTGSIIVGDIKELSDQSYDVITLWHVLEHLHQLNETIEKIKERLDPNGTVFIAVPNYESFDSKNYDVNWAAYDVPRHLWHFNKKSMTQLLENHGFKVLDIQPMKMDSYYVSLLSENYKKPNTNKLLLLLKAGINGIKSNIYGNKTSNYSSLIYVTKKHE